MNKNKQRHNRGAAIVEMALVITILFVLTFGAIEYGWLFLKTQQITHVAREAARRGCVEGATLDDVDDSIETTMDTHGMGDLKGYVHYDNPVDYSRGQQYQVDVNIPTGELVLINVPELLPVPPYLRASVSMMKEGP